MSKTKKNKKNLNLFVGAIIVFVSAILAQVLFSAFAASGTLNLSSNKSSIVQGESVAITLRASVDSEASIAQARVTFNASQLQFQSVSYSGSPFGSDTPDAQTGSGFVQVSRFTPPPFPSGNIYIATINFTALQSSGSASLSIDTGSSAIYAASDASNILTGTSGTVVALQSSGGGTPPSTTPPPVSTNPSSPSSSGSTSSGGTSSGSGSTDGGAGTASGGGDGTAPESLSSNATTGSTTSTKDLQSPGVSKLGTQPSLAQRGLALVRKFLPFALVVTLAAVIAYLIANRLHHHAHSGHIAATGTPTPTGNTSGPTMVNHGPAGPGSGVLIATNEQKKHTNDT